MAYLTVVFDVSVPETARTRILAALPYPAIPDESEAGAWCVEVPEGRLWQVAHRYADLQYNGRPAIARVSYTRLRKEVDSVER